MSELNHNKLNEIEILIYEAEFDKALIAIKNRIDELSEDSEEYLQILILKARIFNYLTNYKKALEIGEFIYSRCKDKKNSKIYINTLLINTRTAFLGNIEKSKLLIEEVQNCKGDKFEKADLLYMKSILYYFNDNYEQAISNALQSLNIFKILEQKLDIANVSIQLAQIYILKFEVDLALEYALNSLDLYNDLNHDYGVSECLSVLGGIYYSKRDFKKSLKYIRQSIKSNKISDHAKLSSYGTLGTIYREKGELTRALRYYNRGIKLSEEMDYNDELIITLLGIGSTYRIMGAHDKAIEYFEKSLRISKNCNYLIGLKASLFYLTLVYLDKNFLNKAETHLSRLEEIIDNKNISLFNHAYLIGKALILKLKGRFRDRIEAENLLKQTVEDTVLTPQLHLISTVNLCELYLEELSMTNNPDILEEIDPLIKKMYAIAEAQHSFSWLAETKLLNAKLKLIYMELDESNQLMTEAQKIADMHGLNLLAIKISSEHDNFLEHLDDWKNLSKSNAPMSERIKLASINNVMERLQGKRGIEPPKIENELPILLLIMNKDGISHFTHPFVENWEFGDLFSAFMTAFNSFSSEIFSKSIDRVKIGDNVILINPIEPFLICYVIKGQSYPAQQKLNKFTNGIKDNTEIWNSLNNSIEACTVLATDNPPELGNLVHKIFSPK
jgi:tetratricopeptide (TPR) repeat protein